MATVPSMGDVLMLSHTAKSIGKAFGHKDVHVPQDFFEVERETLGLADALKLLAYTLEEDETMLRAETEIQQGISTILTSAQVTLRDLAAFVERYSTFSRVKTRASAGGDKVWAREVLDKWDLLPWTRDGGDMNALRSLLMTHCGTITMTTQALQSQSPERLEKTILPLAAKLEGIHDDIPGKLNQRLDELHFISMTIMHEQRNVMLATRSRSFSPQLQDFEIPTTTTPDVGQRNDDRDPATLDNQQKDSRSRRNTDHTWDEDTILSPKHQSRDHTGGLESCAVQREILSSRPQSQLTDYSQHSKRSKSADGATRSRFPFFSSSTNVSAQTLRSQTTPPLRDVPQCPPTPRRLQKRRPPPSQRKSMPLPDSIDYAIHGRTELSQKPSRTSMVSAPLYEGTTDEGPPKLPTPPTSRISLENLLDNGQPSEATFTEHLLKDSIKMFDERGRLVEALSSEPKKGQKQAVSVNTIVSKACRIMILRRKTGPDMEKRWSTSIWIIAADFSVRLEHPLFTNLQPRSLAPHVAVKMPERVALTIPSKIQYHTPVWGCVAESASTSLQAERVTYTFLSAQAASRFQSVIFGQQLLDSFRIDRATLLRPGGGGRQLLHRIMGSEEQICGQQRIRLWEDTGAATPSAPVGGVLGLMHVQPSFGQGWIKWWINSARVAQIKSKGNGTVEIRGIDCLISAPVPQPLKTVDNFTQCSLVAGVPAPAFKLASSHVSTESRGTSMSAREEARMRHSPSPSLTNMRVEDAPPPLPHNHQIDSHSIHARKSNERSRSASRSRGEVVSSAPVEVGEPVPTVRSDASLTQSSTTTISKQAPSPPATRSISAIGLAPPPTPGKWDTPISPRNFKPRKPAQTATASPLVSEPMSTRSAADPALPPISTQLSTPTKPDPRRERPPEPRVDSRNAPRDFDSMSIISQRSKATTTLSARSRTRSWKSGRGASREMKRNQPREEKKKVVHGIKIHFSTEDDKGRFLACVARAREKMLPLPDL
ncbi:Copper-transporting ATPase ccc2 [Sphaceloma murrayae]|uniref:Copper-transporting ATPase ccc2 n=1 Tax=Sphaceloma murrayae TaxID=2082308 RepID=A0A2K1QSV5_9PEZI|nr:Copper-transporting ATPase ccc2 [Sphaceloma murrayae]